MSFPQVKVSVSNGNLLRSIKAPDAVPALLCAGYSGDTVSVYSADDAEKKKISGKALSLCRMFYKELAGNTRLYIAANTEANLEKLVQDGANIVAWIGDSYKESDLVSLSGTLKSACQKLQSTGCPVRVLVGGDIDETTLIDFSVKSLDNPYIGIVAGVDSETGASLAGSALARCCKYGAHIKLGNGQNGALLSITDVAIGGKPYAEYLLAQLEVMHGNGYIMPQHRSGLAGYYFGVDNMCTDSDLRILAYGRIIDKAQAIIQQTYAPFVETAIRVSSDGTLDEGDVSYLENLLECSILSNMTEQISGVKVVIDKNQDIINNSTLAVSCSVQPLGYATWINVTLGLATALDN